MNATQNGFFRMAVPAAQYTQKIFGVPASITLAQAILESGWGQSKLAEECNNYFGVKAAHDAAPDTYEEFPTTEFVNGQRVPAQADFAKYACATLGFAAHARLLAAAPRYRPAMAVKNDPAQFAEQLQLCGYSTNPQYAADLMHLVRYYDLTQYDVEPEPPAVANELAA